MKNIKINTKKLAVILIAGFILVTSTGCSKQNKGELNNNYKQEYNQVESSMNEKEEQTNNTTSIKQNITDSNKVEEVKDESNSFQNNTVENPVVSENEYTKEDIKVINYFDNIEKSVDTELQNETSETVKDKLKGTFITVVDFLFYDSEINGIKFDDLTEGAKQNILETVTTIDNKIMTKYPNYKEEISSTTSKAYQRASELIKKGANNIKEFSKEKLGEENYNAIIGAKDELVYYTKNAVNIIGDIAGSFWETGKSKIKTWYENFKN